MLAWDANCRSDGRDRSRLRGAVNGADFLLLLGGDCSIVLGALLGLRRAGRAPAGLVYIDGHADYATLDESPTGSACSMSLALAVGRRNSTRLAYLMTRPHSCARPTLFISVAAMSPIRSMGVGPCKTPRASTSVMRSSGLAVPQRFLSLRSSVSPGLPAGSGSISTPTCSIHESCRRWTVRCRAGSISARLPPSSARSWLIPAARGLQLTIYDPIKDRGGVGAERLVDLLVDLRSADHPSPRARRGDAASRRRGRHAPE
jgi:arginase